MSTNTDAQHLDHWPREAQVATRGRKQVKPSIAMVIWLLVELARDRRRWGKPRASSREAAHRLAEELAECFQGGRVLPPETVRRYHKEFQKVMRKGGDEAELANRLLDNARQRRDLLGWETSTWVLAFLAEGGELILTPGELLTH